jgi:hypothetical protein
MHADLRSWLGLGAGLAVALIAIAIGNLGQLVYLMDVHPGVAGWVQALGGILAVYAAFRIARSQDRANLRAWSRRQWALEDAAMATAARAIAAMDALIFVLTDARHIAARAEYQSELPDFPLQDAIEDLKSFPIHEMEDAVPGLAIRRLHHHLRNLDSLKPKIEGLVLEAGTAPEELGQTLKSMKDRGRSIREDLSTAIDQARARRG